MTMLEWAGFGALAFALFIFCARIMRAGLTTLDDDRKRHSERISEEKRHIAEDNRNISAGEQLYLAEAAVRDLLRLEQSGCELGINEQGLELRKPGQIIRIRLLMREVNLRSRHAALHGQSRWLLEDGEMREQHGDIASLMASLREHLRGNLAEQAPAHIARRLNAARSARRWVGDQENYR